MTGSEEPLDFRRRRLLAAMTVGCLSPFMSSCAQKKVRIKSNPTFNFLSANTQKESFYSISGVDSRGQETFSISSGIRYHSGVFHPRDHRVAVVVSRRPGTHLLVLDTLKGRLIKTIKCPENRHFYGHACFSSGGAYVYTTENDYAKGVGVIGVWDASTYSRLGEMSCHGIGPHDVHLLPDNKTLIVAVGGIRTHPDYRRRKLNLETMGPALVYMNVETGQLIYRITIQNHFLSIRHLAVTEDGSVLIAMQYQGSKMHVLPLLGRQYGDKPIEMFQAPDNELRRMRQYTASICFHSQSGIVGVTCPRGNIVTFWQLDSRRWVKTLAIADAGGIGLDADKENFMITTGSGKIFQVNPVNFESRLLHVNSMMGWDNHMIVSGG